MHRFDKLHMKPGDNTSPFNKKSTFKYCENRNFSIV